MEKLQFITHNTQNISHYDSAKIALEGGIRWIQFRMKDVEGRLFETEALRVKELCKTYGALCIINDNPYLAARIDADGVHLGKDDMSPVEARKFLGKDKIIGGTANTYQDIEQLVYAGVDYIGLGPFRFTKTKENLSPSIGLKGYKALVQKCQENQINTPIYAIGGITKNDIVPILQTGIYGIALSSSILAASNGISEVKNILEEISKVD